MRKILLLFIVIMTINCQNSQKNESINKTLKHFKEIKIDKQIWMVENLNEDKFRNGDVIPQAKSREEWIKAGKEKKPVWCYFNNDSKNGSKFGRLYNWYAVADSRGLAPFGWHIPSEKEWIKLIEFLGG